MALSADLYSYKSSGVYTSITDLSQVDIEMLNDRVMPLVLGFADNGARGCMLPITSYNQFVRYYGSANPKCNDKGNYFHKVAERLLTNGRWIYAMNLAPLNETNIQNGLFDKSTGYTPNYNYVSDEDTDKFVKIYNSGKPTHLFIFNNNSALGYDISVTDYYASPSLNPYGKPVPDFIENPNDTLVSSFYRSIYVFDGYFDDAFLGSLYNNGYTKIIKPTVKLKVGIVSNDLTTNAESSPTNQKVEFTGLSKAYVFKNGYTQDNTDYILTNLNLIEKQTLLVELTPESMTIQVDNTPVTLEKYSIKMTTGGRVYYFPKGQLDGTVMDGIINDATDGQGEKMIITYSDASKSDNDNNLVGVLTFDSTGFRIEPNIVGSPIYYTVTDNDRVKVPAGMKIKLPTNCQVNIDNDGTQTTLTNIKDELAVGDYSKIILDKADEVYIIAGPKTYITEKGILFEGDETITDDKTYNGSVEMIGENLNVVLSYIGDIDIQEQQDGKDRLYIDLTAKNSHTFTFNDNGAPFIIVEANNDIVLTHEDKYLDKGMKGNVQFPLYAVPNDDCIKTAQWITVTYNLDSKDYKLSNNWTLTDLSESTKSILNNNCKKLSWKNASQVDEEIGQGFVLYGGEKAVETLSMVDGSGFIGKYVGFAIPDFVDALGINQDIKNAFNKDVFYHNMLLGTTSVDESDTATNCLKNFSIDGGIIPYYDTNPLASALIDSESAEKTAYKLIYGSTGKTLDEIKANSFATYDIIPVCKQVKQASICRHTGKKHKLFYGSSIGYNYDYDMLETDKDSKKFNKVIYNCLVENQYVNYRYIVDTLITNGTFLTGENCVKYNGVAYPASVLEATLDVKRPSIMHWNLFKIAGKYGKASALVNAPYPLKNFNDEYTVNKECMPGEGDGNWMGTYTAAYKMMNYDVADASVISCQGHIYPTSGPEADLCLRKHETRFPYSVVAGPNYGNVVDNYITVPAEAFDTPDADYYETLGINLLQWDINAGTNIKSNQTAKQRIVSALSKFNTTELIVYMTIEMQKIMKQLQWEANTPQIREYLKAKADAFCASIQHNKGILTFYNICNASNNPPEVIDNEMIVLDTGIEPSRASGKMVNRLKIYKTGGIELSGLV